MIAALGSLAFLATLWLLVVLGAGVLEESGAKIAAALKGEIARQRSFAATPARLRPAKHLEKAMRGNLEWRAAA